MPAFDEWEQDLANAAKELKLTVEPLPDDPESMVERRFSVKKGKTTIGTLELEILEPGAMSKAELAESIQAYGEAVEYQSWTASNDDEAESPCVTRVADALRWLLDQEKESP
jgi:hypothetical protein